MNYRIPNCNKGHHTSLHKSTQITTQTNQNIASNNLNNNNLEKNTFLQIIPITISNGTKYIKTNVLLDAGSDATLLKNDIAKKLGLNGDYKNLRITNAISKTSELESKHVSFKVSSESHPNFIDIENAWVVSDLDIKCQPMNVFKLKKDFDHLRDLDLLPLNPGGVSLLVGTDFAHLFLDRDFKSGESHQPFAVKTLLGWVLMGGKGQSKNLNSNFINTSFDLEQFWNLENYGTLPKIHPNLLTKDGKRAVNTLENTCEFIKGKYQVGLLWKKDNEFCHITEI